jgi:signal peptidase II
MLRWLLIAGVVVVLDQITKYVAIAELAGQAPVEVTSFFNLLLVYNRGAAFSFLAGMGGWQRYVFTVLALVASVWIIYLLRRYPQQSLFCLALSLVLGGAIGNVIDRMTIGAVVDFLDFHAYGWHWPAFNVADSAITGGAVLLIWDGLRGSPPGTEKTL